jgi:hypothetical protein
MAARRILRLALGTSLALFFSQAISWPLSFVSAVLAMFILALPLPVMNLKKGIAFSVALLLPMISAMALLPFLQYARWAGVFLVALALYYTFYFTAKGGPAVIGMFMTVGLTLTVTVGSVNPQVQFILIQSLAKGVVFALAFVWLAHFLLPDLPAPVKANPAPAPAPQKTDLAEARRSALRSLFVVLPMALLFLFMSGSPSYTVIMIKVASMGQQATAIQSRQMSVSLLKSTLWGGLAALIAWTLLSAWPSLLFYSLLILLAGLVFGRGIFQGPAMHPEFSKWSYAFLTMIVILAPAVLDGQNSAGAGAAIWTRLWLFVLIAIYGTAAVAVFDAFWGKRTASEYRRQINAANQAGDQPEK